MPVLPVVQILSLFRRFHTISRKLQKQSRNVQKQVNVSRFLQLQKVLSPKKMHSFLRKNTKKNWKQEQRNIRPFPMRSQIRSTKNLEMKYVSQFPDIHKEVENLVHTTVFFLQESVQAQHRQSLTASMA